MINVTAFTLSRVQHDGVVVMSMIYILFMRAGFTPIMWKGDGSKAFRRLPVAATCLGMMWTTWSFLGCLYVPLYIAVAPFWVGGRVSGLPPFRIFH
jgi:hypothetical protein